MQSFFSRFQKLPSIFFLISFSFNLNLNFTLSLYFAFSLNLNFSLFFSLFLDLCFTLSFSYSFSFSFFLFLEWSFTFLFAFHFIFSFIFTFAFSFSFPFDFLYLLLTLSLKTEQFCSQMRKYFGWEGTIDISENNYDHLICSFVFWNCVDEFVDKFFREDWDLIFVQSEKEWEVNIIKVDIQLRLFFFWIFKSYGHWF